MSKLIESITLLSEFTNKSVTVNCTVHQEEPVHRLIKACVATDDSGDYINYIRCDKCPFCSDNLNLLTQTLKENIQNV